MKKLFYTILILLFSVNVSALDVIVGLKGFGTDTRAMYGNSQNPVICVVDDLTFNNGTLADDADYGGSGNAVKLGSFRECVNWDPGVNENKLIIFAVSGYIDGTNDNLNIQTDYLTIAGQTAPSPGITLKKMGLRVYDSHDVVIQHIRSRYGDDETGQDDDPRYRNSISVLGAAADTYNVVIDHCSASWATDQNMQVYENNAQGPNNVTISNCIISEGLSYSIHPNGEHSKGILIGDNVRNIAVLYNLFAHNRDRNPTAETGSAVIANNVIYNHENWGIFLGKDYDFEPDISILGNVAIRGKNSGNVGKNHTGIWIDDYPSTDADIYMLDNISENDTDGDASGDAWDGVFDKECQEPYDDCNEQYHRVESAPITITSFTAIASENVQNYVLANVGARPGNRDETDTCTVNSVTNVTGEYINAPSASCAGAYPALAENSAVWTLPAVATIHDDAGSGYTNLEEWLHDFAEALAPTAHTPYPADGATGIPITADLTWVNAVNYTHIDLFFEDATPPTNEVHTDESVATYDPDEDTSLVVGTTYYWYLVTDDLVTGPTWSFTTQGTPPALSPGISYDPEGMGNAYDKEGSNIE